MDNIQLSQANQVYTTKQNNNTTVPIQTNAMPEPVKDGENKINKVLIGLGILGAAGIAVTCAIRGKKPKNTPNTDDVQKLVKQFQDIDFNKGTAKLKDGTLFTGTVEKVTEKGKISIDYIDGVIQKSTKETNGIEVVKEYTNGVISKRNGEAKDIKKIQNEVKIQQEKLKKLLANNEITSEEFQKQADEIKFKSNNDKAKIKEVFDTKLEAQNKAKAEAERLAKEAQEKAKKEEAERLAREQAEKEAKQAQEKAAKEAQEKAEKIKKIDIEWQKAKKSFFDENIASIPSTAEERAQILRKKGMPEWVISTYCDSEEGYLNYLWQQTSQNKEFVCKKILTEMDEKELSSFNQAKKTLDKYNIRYNEYELLTRRQFWGMTELHSGLACNGHAYPYAINQSIRQGKINTDNLDLECRILDKAFETITPTTQDIVVYRGVSDNDKTGFIKKLLSMKKGEIYTDKAYSYSSFKESIGKRWAGDCFLEIKVPKGAKVSQARASEQSELLFPRNSRFRILQEATQMENGKHKLIVEYILPN